MNLATSRRNSKEIPIAIPTVLLVVVSVWSRQTHANAMKNVSNLPDSSVTVPALAKADCL